MEFERCWRGVIQADVPIASSRCGEDVTVIENIVLPKLALIEVSNGSRLNLIEEN